VEHTPLGHYLAQSTEIKRQVMTNKIVYCVVCNKEFTSYPGWQPIYEVHLKSHGRKKEKRNSSHRRGRATERKAV
jgi:hypothetical protein